ncbi:MAG: endonuclease/exonuclease/phosphatase family protein [Treponema sp.]|nr:endonuclease/exonuclease/phosphatase family protein [Treponema sp.]
MKKFLYLFLLPALTGFALAGLVFACAAALSGCSPEQESSGDISTPGITLMTWNIHNLFDGKDDGFEYDEFLQSAGWSSEKYMGRVNTICDAVEKISPKPDIILLQEIESFQILEDLAEELPAGYSYSHFANNPGSAIGLGILSRYPLTEAFAHSITIDGETTPRPVLEARVQADNNEFIIFVCHWKSKIGGDEATENVRRSSARIILRRIRELSQSEPDTGVIIAGDLNENHNEFYRQGADKICALVPDDPYCATITNGTQKDYFVISGNRNFEPAHFQKETIMLYSPWFRDLENGSYYYQYGWETIDHFLISKQFFNGSGLEYEKIAVINFEPFTNANGIPVPYNTKTGMGISDHLPLLLTLKMADVE